VRLRSCFWFHGPKALAFSEKEDAVRDEEGRSNGKARNFHPAEHDKATTIEGMVALILVSNLNKPMLQFPKTLISAILNSKSHSYDHYLGRYWSDALSD
jgi:hypothetical protein